MKPLHKLYEALINGDNLTNKEVLALMEAFKQAADVNHSLGPRFHMAFVEANNRYHTLLHIAGARNIL